MTLTRSRMLATLAAATAAMPLAVRAADLDVSGTYQTTSTGDGGGSYVMKLSQVGVTVAGTYDSGSASIGGKLVGPRLDGTWHEGSDNGWLTFTFTADGKAFEGQWGYNGAKAAGKWIGKRS